jgi:hypothetical protein
MAVAGPSGTRVDKRIFGGGRLEVKDRATDSTLGLLREMLLNED